MAKNKQGNRPKPDNNEQINKTQQMFAAMSEKDKVFFLQRAGVFFLSWQGRLISPTPELRGLVNQVSRLANITNLLFDRVTKRQADVSALSVVSEEEIQRNVTTPAVEAIGQKVNEIRKVLDEQQTARGGNSRRQQQGKGQSVADTQQNTGEESSASQSSVQSTETSAKDMPAEEETAKEAESEVTEEDEELDESITG